MADNMHEKALNSMFDDMDDLESKKMFGEPDGDEGTKITITVSGGKPSVDTEPDHDEAMCKGGCAYHKGGLAMADGGIVPETPQMGETDDMTLPPFLRKKKKS